MRKYQLVVIVRLSGRRYFCSRKFCKGNKYEIKDNSSDNHCLDCRRYVGAARIRLQGRKASGPRHFPV